MGYVISAMLELAVFAGAIYGYASNIIKLVQLFSAPLGAEVVIRIAGIPFFPLGVIAGYF